MFLDFFQSFPLGFRQEKRGSDEVNHGEAGECKEHCRIAVFADGWQEDGGDGRRNGLVDDQRDAHAVGADARGHQLGQHQWN
jgi:hypothetical protein